MDLSSYRISRQCLSLLIIASQLVPMGLVWATCPVGTAGADTHTCTISATAPVTYTGLAGNDTLTIDASSASTTTVDMGTGQDTVTLASSTSRILNSLVFGTATDIFSETLNNAGIIGSGGASDRVDFGGGNDTYVYGNTVGNDGTINGCIFMGAGNDSLTINKNHTYATTGGTCAGNAFTM